MCVRHTAAMELLSSRCGPDPIRAVARTTNRSDTTQIYLEADPRDEGAGARKTRPRLAASAAIDQGSAPGVPERPLASTTSRVMARGLSPPESHVGLEYDGSPISARIVRDAGLVRLLPACGIGGMASRRTLPEDGYEFGPSRRCWAHRDVSTADDLTHLAESGPLGVRSPATARLGWRCGAVWRRARSDGRRGPRLRGGCAAAAYTAGDAGRQRGPGARRRRLLHSAKGRAEVVGRRA